MGHLLVQGGIITNYGNKGFLYQDLFIVTRIDFLRQPLLSREKKFLSVKKIRHKTRS